MTLCLFPRLSRLSCAAVLVVQSVFPAAFLERHRLGRMMHHRQMSGESWGLQTTACEILGYCGLMGEGNREIGEIIPYN